MLYDFANVFFRVVEEASCRR
ncbi:MAG: hypothetical protein QOJ95_3964, partial [Mycobacterium sp.]|nr:hypothetical protein [Mycobacterium sp.]